MILHARNLLEPTLSADIAVVGAGAAGITLTQSLMRKGREVLLIEGGGLAVDTRAQRLFDTSTIGEPVHPDAHRYRVFGGSTVAWTGRCARLDPIDLERRDWVNFSGWPIAYGDLTQHYPEAAEIVGLAEAWNREPDWFCELYRLPNRPPSVEPFLWRLHSPHRNTFTDFGKAYKEAFAASDRIRVLLEADLVTLCASGGSRRLTHGRFRTRGGRDLEITARTWILCCGGIENARLLLNIACDEPASLAQVEPSIGRWFMQHPRSRTAQIEASPRQADALQSRFNLFRRIGSHFEVGFALTAATQRAEQLLNASAVIRYGGSRTHRMSLGLLPLRRAPERIARVMAGREPRLHGPIVSLEVDSEQLPDRDSRIVLAREKDAIGLRKAQIDWRINPMDRRTTAFLTTAICRWIERSGWGEPRPIADLDRTGGLTAAHMAESYHHLGATRMSRSTATGVVDADLKVHGVDNLYVCGGSVLPTGGHANPTLTIVALALRLAEHLVERVPVF